MTIHEARRQTAQENTLREMGFTRAESQSLRRISRTLRRWFELECGTGDGPVMHSIERDENEIPYFRTQYPSRHGYQDSRYRIADRETGARRRLATIIRTRNARITNDSSRDAERNIHATCHAKMAGQVSAYVQGDPRGAALYILRPGDVPDGQTAESCYSRGVCIY